MKSGIYSNYLPYRLKKNEQVNPLLVMDDLYRNKSGYFLPGEKISTLG